MTMAVHNYRPRQFHRTSNGEIPSSGYRDMGSASLAATHPPGRPPEPWRQYPSSPKGWGVKHTTNWALTTRAIPWFDHILKISQWYSWFTVVWYKIPYFCPIISKGFKPVFCCIRFRSFQNRSITKVIWALFYCEHFIQILRIWFIHALKYLYC